MLLDKQTKMADIALQNSFVIRILERFEIGLGLEEKTVAEVLREHNISLKLFQNVLEIHYPKKNIEEVLLEADELVALVSYLKKSHNFYIHESLPIISKKIKTLYKESDDVLIQLVETFFKKYIAEVKKHLRYEEKTVYPYVLEVIKKDRNGSSYNIVEYKTHHDDIETKLDDLKNLLIKYLPDQDIHKIKRDILLDLFAFEKDLRIHTLIEDKILIPSIEQFEKLS